MAAHIDGRAASAVDMTGLAQKWRRGVQPRQDRETETTPIGGACRPPAPRADRLDLLVAAGPEALALYARTAPRLRQRRLPATADFVTDREARFDGAAMERRIKAATRAYEAARRWRWPSTGLGDAIYANMIMAGLRWQKGPWSRSPPAPSTRHPPERPSTTEANLAGFRGRPHSPPPTPPSAARARTTPSRPRCCRWSAGRPPRRRADRLPEPGLRRSLRGAHRQGARRRGAAGRRGSDPRGGA